MPYRDAARRPAPASWPVPLPREGVPERFRAAARAYAHQLTTRSLRDFPMTYLPIAGDFFELHAARFNHDPAARGRVEHRHRHGVGPRFRRDGALVRLLGTPEAVDAAAFLYAWAEVFTEHVRAELAATPVEAWFPELRGRHR